MNLDICKNIEVSIYLVTINNFIVLNIACSKSRMSTILKLTYNIVSTQVKVKMI